MSERIENILKSMSLEEKVGQIMVCGFDGTHPSGEIKRLIRDYHLGNVILFKRNIEDPGQIRNLTSELQGMSKIPLTMAVDQEGGIVTRLTAPFTVFPGSMATAATGDPNNAYLEGLTMAKEMRAVGLNWNLAPVVDVNDLPQNPGIGVRSYSDEPHTVAKYASEFVRGLHDGKVAGCAKHFPGKGHSAKDAHMEMPTVDRDMNDLVKIDLFPFRELINDGIDAIMPSHVYYPALCESEDLPATLSSSVMTDLLKNQMDFNGVVVTDDLEMGGITKSIKGSDAAWRSLLAGADIVMICHTYDEQIKTFEKIIEKVKFGNIPIERLNDAVRRVLSMKEKLGLLDGQIIVESEIGSSDSAKIAEEIVRKSITLVRDEDQLIEEIGKRKLMVVFPSDMALVKVEESRKEEAEVVKTLKKRNVTFESIYVPSKPLEVDIEKVVKSVRDFDGIILLFTLNAHIMPEFKELVNSVVSIRSKNTILVALRNPYDCIIDGVRNSISLYNYSNLSQKIFIEMCLDGEKFTGHLPVKM